ncbi:pro-sigmaK processing inhibitor BofA family protein [Oceanirhabdus sp. W0125-5]|uniref:pro-sigmaK processing inhibitor BofA family protein n=1 Tax=Oceanirhabdus sp. W0125-5 TaxID=2999116 RepID=UPI0022F2A833|nr:pro-sigmaK processing inhibitor BofA family protein [Oceanirhabdus sp. W0125-5]WBW97553.1 pro-sigmaK processing inhibitor BofA family protein [Oceanirhabdus sp. W0125-5]
MKYILIILLIILIFTIIKIFTLPMRILIKLAVNSAIGLLALIIVNAIGQNFDFSIAINPITVIIAGVLGVPGIVFLAIYTYYFV